MTPFPLKIVTPDGLLFDGEAEEILVRTTSGDAAILAGHINYVAPLGMGRAVVISGGNRRTAACIGGMLSVVDGAVTLVPTTFEWAESIDLSRPPYSGRTRFSTIRHLRTPTCVWRKQGSAVLWCARALPAIYNKIGL